MLSNKTSIVTAHFPSTNPSDSIQRQRSLNRQSKVLKIQSPNLIFTKFPKTSTNNIHQQNLDRQSTIKSIFGNQLQLISRNKSPQPSSVHSKCSSSIYSSTIIDKQITQSFKYSNPHHYPLGIEKKNSIPDFFISPKSINNKFNLFKKTNIKDLLDEWEDPKSNVAVSSDDDDSIITNHNSPILPYNPKKYTFPRRPYSFSLTPVVEDTDD